MRGGVLGVVVALLLGLVPGLPLPPAVAADTWIRHDDLPEKTFDPALSADGSTIVFDSAEDGLVPQDNNGRVDVFAYDVETREIELVSRAPDGSASGRGSEYPLDPFYNSKDPVVSANGRFVAFQSRATNLVPGVTGETAYYRYDRETQEMDLVGYPADAWTLGETLDISDDGQQVAFIRDINDGFGNNGGYTYPLRDSQAFVRDFRTGTTTMVSTTPSGVPGSGDTTHVAISGDGTVVALETRATNLTDDSYSTYQSVVVRDLTTGGAVRASSAWDGSEGAHATSSWLNALSSDGRYVFLNTSSRLVPSDNDSHTDLYAYDRDSGEIQLALLGADGVPVTDERAQEVAVSRHGRYVAYEAEEWTDSDDVAYVHDRVTGVVRRIGGSVERARGSWITGDGTHVMVTSRPAGRKTVYIVASDVAGDRGDASFITRDPIELFGRRQNSGYVSDPVNTASGNFIDERADLDFPGAVFGMAWGRFYNSLDADGGVLGPGWSTVLDVGISVGSDGVPKLRDVDGRRVPFQPDGSGGFERPEELFGDLVEVTGGGWELRWFDGRVWAFDTDGTLRSRSDWTGQTVTYTRDGEGLVTSAASSTGYELTFGYDAASERLLTVTADDGREVVYDYDAAGVLSGVTDPAGATMSYATDADGRVTEVRDGDDRLVVANVYGGEGRVTSQTMPSGAEVRFAYDEATGVTDVTHDATGETTQFHHDQAGRVVAVVDATGQQLAKTYDDAGNLIEVVDRRGNTATKTFDARGNVTSVTEADGAQTTFTHDAADRVTARTDPAGETWTFTYVGEQRVPSTVTDPTGAVTEVAVADGLVSSVVDPDSIRTAFDYDDRRNLTAATDGTGNRTEFGHDGAGRPTSLSTPLGHTSTTVFDAVGRPVSSTDATGATTATTYDAAGNITTVTDPDGGVTTHTHDDAGRLVATTDALGRTTEFVYDSADRLVEERAPGGAVTLYEYGPLGRVATVVDPEGGGTSFAYDADGNVTGVTDPNGHTTTFAYDAVGRVTEETDASGATTTYQYGPRGELTSTTAADDAVTRYEYDAAGRLVRTTDATGNAETRSYTSAGRLATITDATGRQTTFDYDDAGRQRSVTTAAGTSQVAYDADGRVIEETSAAGLVTSYAYDAAGRVVSQTDPAGETTSYDYDGRGQLVEVTDSLGTTRGFSYDAVGQLVEAVDANGGATQFDYDDRGNLIQRTDAAGQNETWSWDLADRLTTTVDELGRDATFDYDPAGQLTSLEDPSGRSEQRTYDPVGRLLERAFGDGTSTAFAYDVVGRLTSVTDGTGTVAYEYDVVGNLSEVTDVHGRTVGYGYDAAGRRISTSYPDGDVAAWGYDAAGRLTSVEHPQLGTATYEYDADGRLVAEQLPAGGSRAYDYDDGRLAEFSQDVPGDQRQTRLAYDPVGRLVEEVTAGVATTYGYDPAGQLVEAVTQVGTCDDDKCSKKREKYLEKIAEYTAKHDRKVAALHGKHDDKLAHELEHYERHQVNLDDWYAKETAKHDSDVDKLAEIEAHYEEKLAKETAKYDEKVTKETSKRDREVAKKLDKYNEKLAELGSLDTDTVGYAYDPVGNRTRVDHNGEVTTFAFDAANQLLEADGPDGRTGYAYDDAGRRIGATSDAGEATTYEWDAQGRLVGSQTTDGGLAVASETRGYSPAGELTQVALESAGSAATVYDLVWDANLAVPQPLTHGIDGTTYELVRGNGAIGHVSDAGAGLFATDAHGSTVATDDTADLAVADSFDPWGGPSSDGDGPGVGYGYRGELHIGDQVHLRARDYTPDTAAFTSVDPLDGLMAHPTLTNGYAYAANDPLGMIDPLGLSPVSDDFFATAGAAFRNANSMQSSSVANGIIRQHVLSQSAANQRQLRYDIATQNCSGFWCGFSAKETALDAGRGFSNFSAGLVDHVAIGTLNVIPGVDIGRLGPAYDDPAYMKSYDVGTYTGVATDLIGLAKAAPAVARAIPQVARSARSAVSSLGNAFSRAGDAVTDLRNAPDAAGSSSWWRRALADETGSISIGRYTPDEQALVELAKDARRTGVDLDDADSLLDWADELGFNSHGPMTHPNRAGFWSQTLHIKIGRYHIGVIE